jgi:hypothetical protein
VPYTELAWTGACLPNCLVDCHFAILSVDLLE